MERNWKKRAERRTKMEKNSYKKENFENKISSIIQNAKKCG